MDEEQGMYLSVGTLLRFGRAWFSIGTMTFTSIRHAHSHHGLTGRGALLRVHVRL
jgi:hypothetical protein